MPFNVGEKKYVYCLEEIIKDQDAKSLTLNKLNEWLRQIDTNNIHSKKEVCINEIASTFHVKIFIANY